MRDVSGKIRATFVLLLYLSLTVCLALLVATIVDEYLQLLFAKEPVAVRLIEAAPCLIVLLVFSNGLKKVREQHATASASKAWLKPLVLFSYKRPSYIQFIWLSVTLATILLVGSDALVVQIASSVFKLDTSLRAIPELVHFGTKHHVLLAWGLLIFASLTYWLLSIWRVDELGKRFSPGSITTKGDKLKFADKAAAEMEILLNTNKAMQVAILDGGRGMGKSSFLRMMIESVDDDDLLYSYISLTETDHTKSYSLLFARRWAEAMCRRYPTFYFGTSQAVLENIARETGNGWLGVIMSFCKEPRWPLRRSAARIKGDNYPSEKYLPSTTSALFGYVPEFSEKYMVVVVDEIERARYAEIYQVIEIIERFRYESQWGMPLKLIFVLCLDRDHLIEARIDQAPNDCHEEATLIKTFLEGNKLIDRTISLPLVDPQIKQKFIVEKIKYIVQKYGISLQGLGEVDGQDDVLELSWPPDSVDPLKQMDGHKRWEDKRAYDFTLWQLMAISPREVTKILNQSDELIGRYIDGSETRDPNEIRLSDFILLTYAKNQPQFTEFIRQVMPLVFREDMTLLGEVGDFVDAFEEHSGKKPPTFEELFKKLVNSNATDTELGSLRDLVAALCYPIIQYTQDFSRSYDNAYKHVYDRTLGLYENLRDVLDLATDKTLRSQSSYLKTQRAEIFMNKNNKMPEGVKFDSSELLALSRNLRRYFSGDYKASWVLANEIANRMLDNSIETTPGDVSARMRGQWGTLYNDLTYGWLFHFVNYVKRDAASLSDSFRLLKKLLRSEDVLIESKMTILRNLFAKEQPNNQMDYELKDVRAKLETKYKKQIESLIKSTLASSLKRYMPGSGKIIYDFEENFFNVLYELWDGSTNTAHIREIALNGLQERPAIIESYWERERQLKPMNPQGFDNRNEFPLHASDLIEVTRKAKRTKSFIKEIRFLEDVIKTDQVQEPIPPLDGRLTATQMLRRAGYLK